mmetsp:Transcript_13941/g.32593  ORF Transcript_13941/g.32593 Transcript_13941/m.32593 type:complete len:120 (-) Transcript_13941:257-616(-)
MLYYTDDSGTAAVCLAVERRLRKLRIDKYGLQDLSAFATFATTQVMHAALVDGSLSLLLRDWPAVRARVAAQHPALRPLGQPREDAMEALGARHPALADPILAAVEAARAEVARWANGQ